ncbi:serine/threonine-protein kinase [Georgenia muralis]|uniref:serine/threonine-protein kinase n=1 Tax=Georgenia muralis TaxID=154117 RepID=UPI0014774BF0|nr:serine/threonine-protein kinase [Georgenia muralis]
MENVVLAGRYELRRPLGRGGMAEVWAARDLVLGRSVAVKTVDLDAAGDPTLGDRLRREAVATAALDHPDVVTVYDAGVDGDTAYLVMELLGGHNLAAVLQEGPLTEPDALRVGSRVAGALAVAHAAGIVHRDIKPANILLDGDKVTVVDFGIAAVEHAAAAALTGPGTTLGTAEYMAPEQARAEPVTAAADMYSLGCLLTTLLAGRPPFTGDSPIAVLHQHVAEPAPRLKDLVPGVAPEVDDLVTALLEKDPAGRPTAVQAHELLAGLAERSGAVPAVGAAGAAGSVDVTDLPTGAMALVDWPETGAPAPSATPVGLTSGRPARPAPASPAAALPLGAVPVGAAPVRSVGATPDEPDTETTATGLPAYAPARAGQGRWLRFGIAAAVAAGLVTGAALATRPPADAAKTSTDLSAIEAPLGSEAPSEEPTAAPTEESATAEPELPAQPVAQTEAPVAPAPVAPAAPPAAPAEEVPAEVAPAEEPPAQVPAATEKSPGENTNPNANENANGNNGNGKG